MGKTKHDQISLHPDHLADLKKSGLSDETILLAKVYSVPPHDITKKLGANYPDVKSVLAFPYPGCDGFERYKPFPSLDGKPKYLQKKDTGSHLYIPEKVRPILPDTSVPIYIAEGEKKALKACQEGMDCIAIGGLWNWSDGSENKNLIPDFNLISFDGRPIFIIPDNDWLNLDRHGERRNLRQAVHQLAYRLIDRGTSVYIIELPQGTKKTGLDDYLLQHTVEEIKGLPKKEIRKLTIAEMITEASADNVKEIVKRIASLSTETEKAIYVDSLSEKLGISKREIQKDLKKKSPGKIEGKGTTTTAYFQGLVDLCIDDDDGNIAFLIKNGNSFEVVVAHEIDGQIYTPPAKQHLPFELPRAREILRWVQDDDGQKLFENLEKHLKQFSFLPDHQWTIVALFAFLTYIADRADIYYFPMLMFWASPERGKSRTGKALTYVCYRGVHLVDLREANLFRYSENLHATLFFDFMNLWKKAESHGTEDIFLLRYEKGAKVARVLYPERGAFEDTVFYNVYGATIIATNEPVRHILDTRCIPISMPNKPGDYENPKAEKGREMKERLTAWRARVMAISLPKIEPIRGLNGRLWDISKPLFQVCKLVCPDKLEILENAILEIAGQRVEDRRETIEGQIVSIIHELSPEGLTEWRIVVQEILDKLNEKRPEGHKLTSQYLGRRIKALGFKTRRVHGRTEVLLSKPILQTFLFQYGLDENSSTDPPGETLPNSTSLQNSMNSNGYSGTELVALGRECKETLPITLPDKAEGNQEVNALVQRGRVFLGGREDNLNSSFEANLLRGEI